MTSVDPAGEGEKQEVGEVQDGKTTISHKELITALNSDNIEIIHDGLSRFNRALSRLVRQEVDSEVSGEAELIQDYIKGSPECAELFRVWDYQQNNQIDRLESIIYDVLGHIISALKMAGHRSVGTAIVRSIIRNHMKPIYRNLSSGKHTVIQSTLRLLVSMAGHSQSTTRELQETFNFSMKTVDMILSALQRNVIDDPHLSRAVKVSFFNNYILEQLLRLYLRSDPARTGAASVDGETTVADSVHDFLLHLCTVPGVGLCYQDAGWYPPAALGEKKSVKLYNGNLLRLLKSLRPTEDQRQEALVLAILKSCPELVPSFWHSSANLSFEPRLSSRWLANMALAAKVIRLPVPDRFGATTMQQYPPSVNTIADNIIPSPTSRTLTGRALQHNSRLVKYTAAGVLSLAFEKLTEVRRVLNTMESESPDPNRWRKCWSDLLDEVRRRVPELQIILALQQPVTSKAPSNGDTIELHAHGEDEGDAQANETEKDITPELLQGAALRLLRHYQSHFPAIVSESRFDFGKLVPGDLEALPTDLQWHLLTLICGVRDFKWWSKAAGYQFSHLQSILTLHLTSTDTLITNLTNRVLRNLLSNSFLFTHHQDEIPIYLSALRLLPAQHRAAAIQWLDESLCTGVKNPYRIVDKLSSALDRARETIKDERSLEIVAHLLAVKGSRVGGVGMEVEEDGARFPIGPGLVCVLEGAVAVVKRGKEGKAGFSNNDVRHVLRALYFVVIGLVNSTQGVGEVTLEVIRQSVRNEDVAAIGSDVANDFFGAMQAYCERYCGGASHGEDVPDAMEVDVSLKHVGLREKKPNLDKFFRFMDSECTPASFDSIAFTAFTVCRSNPEFIAPLRSFVAYHYPLSGSLFRVCKAFSQVAEAETLDESDSAVSILLDIPITVIVSNVFEFIALSKSNALPHSLHALLLKKLETTSWREWVGLVRQALMEVTCIMHNVEHRFLVATDVARVFWGWVLEKARSAYMGNETIFEADSDDVNAEAEFVEVYVVVRELLFKHPAILGSFLNQTVSVDTTAIFNIVHETLKNESTLAQSKQRGLPPLWHLYTSIIRSNIHTELTAQPSKLSRGSVEAFSTFRAFMASDDVDHIITLLFQSEETSDLHDRMLSIALSGGGGIGMGRKIGIKSFGKLLLLTPKRPSEELDSILLKTVEACYLPDAVRSAGGGGDVVRVVIDDGEEELTGLYADVASIVDEETVRFLFSTPSQARSNILRYLLEAATSHRALVADLVCEAGKEIDVELALVLLDGMIMALSVEVGGKIDWIEWVQEKEMEAMKVLQKKVKKTLAKEITAAVVGRSEIFRRGDLRAATFARRLIDLFPKTFTPSLLDNVVEQLHASQDTPEDWALACSTLHQYSSCFIAMAKHDDAGSRGISLLIIICLKVLREFYAQSKKDIEVENDDAPALVGVLERSLEMIEDGKQVEVVEEIMKHAHGRDFVKSYMQSTLRYRLGDSAALAGLAALVRLLYTNESSLSKSGRASLPFDLPTLVDMIMTHSQSKRILLPTCGHAEDAKSAGKVGSAVNACHSAKFKLVILLETIMTIDPAHCCKNVHIPVLAAAYQATVSEADQTILRIWNLYEIGAGVSVAEWVGSWNGAGVMGGEEGEQGAADDMVVTHTNVLEALNAIDPVWMAGSIQYFDPHAAIQHSHKILPSQSPQASRHFPIYSPAFFLPLLISVLQNATESTTFDSRRIVDSNVLGLAIMSLSSTDMTTRRAAYCTLDWAYQAIQQSDFKEQKQVLLLLDGVRNSVVNRPEEWSEEGVVSVKPAAEKVAQRIPSVVALFAAQALMVLLKPESDMFMSVNRFLLQRPVVDFADVPLFYDLFYSPSADCRRERVWILRLLSCGLKVPEDYALYKRRHVMDILMGFFPSPLADTLSRKLIFEIIFKASFIPSVITDMVKKSGLLTFLSTLPSSLIFEPSNDLALALPRLCTRVLKGWLKSDPEWYGRNGEGRKVWMDGFANLCLGIVDAVCGQVGRQGGKKEAEGAKKTEKGKWWSRVVRDTLEFVGSVVDGFAEVYGDEGVTPFGLTIFDSLRGVVESGLAGCDGDEAASTIKQTTDDELDLDALYVTDGDVRSRYETARRKLLHTFVRIRMVLPEPVTLHEGGLDVVHSAEGMLSWAVTCIYGREDVWESREIVRKFLQWLLRMQQSSPGVLLQVLTKPTSKVTCAELIRLLTLLSARVSVRTDGEGQLRLMELAVANLVPLCAGFVEIGGGKKRKRKDDEDYDDTKAAPLLRPIHKLSLSPAFEKLIHKRLPKLLKALPDLHTLVTSTECSPATDSASSFEAVGNCLRQALGGSVI
ncbi:hypothetical protein HK097_000025 [Rhizophlyctis rosea]|uniref:Nucleolar pre-ribosomal-associated protein 1 n=1 Tax=Rhizophlyctis rosea TaxID=64517 RepID=A0AAD5XAI9_9FUNG|nr:hypothetical protein HK097_000025 [Rhizophlyctis rosea]